MSPKATSAASLGGFLRVSVVAASLALREAAANVHRLFLSNQLISTNFSHGEEGSMEESRQVWYRNALPASTLSQTRCKWSM